MEETKARETRETRETRAKAALKDLGLEIAEHWVNGFEKRPTQQLVLQKFIDPIVRHILNSIFPWVVGVAILLLTISLASGLMALGILKHSQPADLLR